MRPIDRYYDYYITMCTVWSLKFMRTYRLCAAVLLSFSCLSFFPLLHYVSRARFSYRIRFYAHLLLHSPLWSTVEQSNWSTIHLQSNLICNRSVFQIKCAFCTICLTLKWIQILSHNDLFWVGCCWKCALYRSSFGDFSLQKNMTNENKIDLDYWADWVILCHMAAKKIFMFAILARLLCSCEVYK